MQLIVCQDEWQRQEPSTVESTVSQYLHLVTIQLMRLTITRRFFYKNKFLKHWMFKIHFKSGHFDASKHLHLYFGCLVSSSANFRLKGVT